MCFWYTKGKGRYVCEVVDVPSCKPDVRDEDREELASILDNLYTNWSVDYCPFCGSKIEAYELMPDEIRRAC